MARFFIFCACDKQPLADRLRSEKRRLTGQSHRLRQHCPVLIVRRRVVPIGSISKLAACYGGFAKPLKIGLAAASWVRSWRCWRGASPFGGAKVSFTGSAPGVDVKVASLEI